MKGRIDRREFVKSSAKLGVSFALGPGLAAKLVSAAGEAAAPDKADVAVAVSADYGKAAEKAVAMLGGMKAFVGKGAKVAVLINVQSKNPGTYTKPEILRAVIRMCRDAGAAETNVLSLLGQKNWDELGLSALVREEGATLRLLERDGAHFRSVPVPDGRALAEARVLAAVYEHDVFLNMPVTKDHAGNKFTGTMKNLMGVSSGPSNRTFHKENWKTDPNDIAHLDQCIVDLNKVVQPTLNIVDAAEFITTNGPFGPGELIKPQRVIAGRDRVAIDATCCQLWGLKPAEIMMIARGAEQGVGVLDPDRIRLREEKA